jgi:hypothetical protein
VKSVKKEQIMFIAARKNLPTPEDVTDPFNQYRDFGAGLWRDEYADELNVFPVVGSTYCHAISMPWKAGMLVMKPLNRVGAI